MKRNVTKTLLTLALLTSGNAMSQYDFIQKQDVVESSNMLENFRVRIYPNPSFISEVKMEWEDWAEITTVELLNTDTGQTKIVEIEEGRRKVRIENLLEGNYIAKFYQKDTLFGTKKVIVIN